MDVRNTEKLNQSDFLQWLVEERHISLPVAMNAGVAFVDDRVQIPVRDRSGKILFNKYRRAPSAEEGPKYTYQAGATAALYGLDFLEQTTEKVVIVTEGELDALALQTLGNYVAVSSTGGSGTWKQEWEHEFTSHVPVIAYDADRAGVEGALRVAGMLRGAHIAWLPVQYGKDATEIIHAGRSMELQQAIIGAHYYDVPGPDLTDESRLASLRALSSVFYKERDEMNRGRDTTPFHMDIAIHWVNNEIRAVRQRIERPVRKQRSDDRLIRAKEYPIKDIVKVNRDGFAKCVYHDEKSESMKVYADNHAFSYCCSKRSDAIDIYVALNTCSIKQAIDYLSV